MKIRIKGDAIRFRLTQSEVKQLSDSGYIEEQTHFESSVFTYAVKAMKGLSQLEAAFEGTTITLFMPEDLCENWFYNDQVGYSNQMLMPSGRSLGLLLEKDFTCMDNTIEDQSDNYPNPKLQ
ncbi:MULTISPECIES: hypothetical protein [Flavobacteriaceae]|uniref:DUF7009 family protein n=1 Tax=Flavobacteriaceae TaxID=49546 RepID=UPI0010ADA941|nr:MULTISPECIES: hypothetical protein [Flavobacteriaceae]NJB36348.1 hypothetical protein [Croceivirga sp. JEA036]TKD66504.1 hypothetical protein FBT53_01205 [Flavobacterium sp. ASW18X]